MPLLIKQWGAFKINIHETICWWPRYTEDCDMECQRVSSMDHELINKIKETNILGEQREIGRMERSEWR